MRFARGPAEAAVDNGFMADKISEPQRRMILAF